MILNILYRNIRHPTHSDLLQLSHELTTINELCIWTIKCCRWMWINKLNKVNVNIYHPADDYDASDDDNTHTHDHHHRHKQSSL